MTRFHKLIVFCLALFSVGYAVKYMALFEPVIAPGSQTTFGSNSTAQNPAASKTPVPYTVVEVAQGLRVPWSLVFTSPTRMLVSERPGTVRAVVSGVLQKEPVYTFQEVQSTQEEGLLSLALDPNYTQNKYVYAAVVYPVGKKYELKIVRLTDEERRLANPVTIFDHIPSSPLHTGSRLAFGPDGMLYVTTGDSLDKKLPPDTQSLAGKILRIKSDGSIPADNPFGNAVWSFGHRNPQGLSFAPNGELYASEHGPSLIDGPAGGDEINRIVKGGNYGWPDSHHAIVKPGTIQPLAVFTPAEAPASLLVYSGSLLPQFYGNLFFGALKGAGLVRVVVSTEDPNKVMSIEKLSAVRFGRIREVVQGPDGAIYFSTSNRDGRGKPEKTDDRIFKIVPQNLK